eukprot:4054751-Pleurochrysis_carterae.AAC.1
MARCEWFWNNLSQEERHQTVFNVIQFESVAGDLHSEDAQRAASVCFLVGSIAGRQRLVCKCVFHAKFPLSIPTINRIIASKRNAPGVMASTALAAEYQGRPGVRREAHISNKTAHSIAWWLKYA